MKKPYLLLLLFFLPLFTLAQRGYNSVGVNSSYQKPVYSRFGITKNEYRRAFINGIGVEKYFISGIKLSLGLDYVYGTYKYSGNYTDSNSNPIGRFSLQSQYYTMRVPVTFAYNIIPKVKNLQLFMVAGYSFSKHFFYRSKYYNSLVSANETISSRKLNFQYGNVSAGVDIRYIIKDKFFMSLSYTVDEMVHPYAFRFLSDLDGTKGIKLGILF